MKETTKPYDHLPLLVSDIKEVISRIDNNRPIGACTIYKIKSIMKDYLEVLEDMI